MDSMEGPRMLIDSVTVPEFLGFVHGFLCPEDLPSLLRIRPEFARKFQIFIGSTASLGLFSLWSWIGAAWISLMCL